MNLDLMNTSSPSTVLVTGASSGIGNAAAVCLARRGYHVLAAVRKQEDADGLHDLGLPDLQPVCPLDLTKPAQIKTIAGGIKEDIDKHKIPPLYALINIAGGGQLAPVELMNMTRFRNELEKRLVGPLSLVQELLPFLRETRGRILWIATPGLFPVPYVTDIHAPDFAVNYIARTLNIELEPDGIRNILIRCGGIDTGSSQRTERDLVDMFNIWPKERLALYKDRLMKVLQDLQKFNAGRTSPGKVAELMANVLRSDRPKTRYQVGYRSKMGALLEKLPQSWVDAIMEKRMQ